MWAECFGDIDTVGPIVWQISSIPLLMFPQVRPVWFFNKPAHRNMFCVADVVASFILTDNVVLNPLLAYAAVRRKGMRALC